jgi:hypothetical protein
MRTLLLLLPISIVFMVTGFTCYIIEAARGRIGRFTRWSELNAYQLVMAIMMLGGAAVFLGTLTIGALLK